MDDAQKLPEVGFDPGLDSLRDEFQALLQKAVVELAGGMDGPMASRRLLQIQKVSEIGQDLLMALGGPKVRRGGRNMGGYLPIPIGDYDEVDQAPLGGMLGATTAVETFGAKIIQEGLANLPNLILMAQAPNLIRAVKTARDSGLPEVADELQRKLHDGLGLDFATQIKGAVDPFGTGDDFEGEDGVEPILTRPPLHEDDLDGLPGFEDEPVPNPATQRPDLIVEVGVTPPTTHEFSPEAIRQHNLDAADG